MNRTHQAVVIACTGCITMVAPLTVAAAQGALEEIVVTASKTGETVRDIAGSVSALTGADMHEVGAQSAEDYLTRMPGVVFNGAAPGASTVTIRGVATTNGVDQGQGTTGVYINGIPLTDPYFSVGTPDIDTFDVDHVEVFRGPQGTLFGSASLGGAVNYVAREPDLAGADAQTQVTESFTRHGGHNSAYKLMLNAPVAEDRFAIRAVGVLRRDSGYLENAGIGDSDANDSQIAGGRLMAAWEPREGARVSWLTLYQKTENDDGFYRNPALGEYRRSTFIAEEMNSDVTLHSLRLEQALGGAELTALATYHEKTQEARPDFTARFGSSLFGGLTGPVSVHTPLKSDGFTYEARLVSRRGGAFEWLVGAMYDRTDELLLEVGGADGAAAAIEAVWSPVLGVGIGELGAPDDVFHYSEVDFRGEETALFGEVAFTFAERLKLTLGGRLFRTETSFVSTGSGFLNLISEGVLESARQGEQKESDFNPKIALSYQVMDDVQVYGLVSKGFRFGGPNVLPPLSGFQTPADFGSDSLMNYELGIKASNSDGAFAFDLTAFRIDWDDIQLRFLRPDGLFYADNAGEAQIWGAEAAWNWRVTPRLALQSNLTWLDAETLEAFDSGAGPVVDAGSRLPGAAQWQAANFLRYSFDSAGAPFLGISHRYISEAPASLQYDQTQGNYSLFDLRAGFTIDRFQITVFVDNVTDEAGITSATFVPQTNERREYILRPRTIGVTLDWKL